MSAAVALLTLAVFDLDQTIWPFTAFFKIPPLSKRGDEVVDAVGEVLKLYPESKAVFEELHERGVKIGIASRDENVNVSEELLSLFDLKKYVSYSQIHAGSKIDHFMSLQYQSGIPYSQMIFFDDDDNNIKQVQLLGVFSVLVPEGGMTLNLLNDSIEKFHEQRDKAS